MKKITLVLMLFIASIAMAQTTPIDFETGGNGAGYTWTVFENTDNPALEIVANSVADPTMMNNSATVAKFTARSEASGAQPYAGTVTSDAATFTLNATNSTVKIMVWKSVISDVGIKFETGTGASTGEIKVANTLVNEWEELTFDFSPKIGQPESTDITSLVIFPDFASGRSENEIYFDNITFSAQMVANDPDNVTVDASATHAGYANVFDLGGGYQFGSGWGVSDIATTFDTGNNTITLQPNFNTYADNPGDAYWRNNGGAGPLGNKVFEGNTFVELANYANASLTFSGNTISHGITSPYDANNPFSYDVLAFIKVLDPGNGFATVDYQTAALSTGQDFTVTSNLTQGLLVQYGFVVKGLNANPADAAIIGTTVVTAVNLSTNDVATNLFSVYPNPTTQDWNITSKNTITSIEIYNVMGKRVAVMPANALNVRVNASNLNSGIYFARVTTQLGSSSVKLIKQ